MLHAWSKASDVQHSVSHVLHVRFRVLHVRYQVLCVLNVGITCDTCAMSGVTCATSGVKLYHMQSWGSGAVFTNIPSLSPILYTIINHQFLTIL